MSIIALQQGSVIHTNETLVVEQCCNCSCWFAMPKDFRDRCLDVGGTFYCPHGHPQSFTTPRNKALKDQVERLEKDYQRAKDYIQEKNNQIQQLGYSVRALKAAKTKIINRVKNGVCPCCNRTFIDLQKHFKSKHPELLTA